MILIFSYCIYCAQAAPPFYALGFSLPERLINIIYDSYYLFMLFCLYYLCGWVARKRQASPSWQLFLEKASAFLRRHVQPVFFAVCAVFVCACVGLCTVSKGENGNPAIQRLPASVQAAFSLVNGEAARYSEALAERESLYHDPSKQEVVVEPLRDKPLLLYPNDITEDAADWRNQAVARYYQKKSVRVREPVERKNG